MNVCLYRQRLSLRSGAGQLVQMQAEGLERAGVRPQLAAEKGRLKFFLRSGRRVRSMTLERARREAQRADVLFIDHSGRVPEAPIVFLHNLECAVAEFVPRDDSAARIAEEAAFFDDLAPGTRVVANSLLVRDWVISRFGLPAERIDVLHPGFRARRFCPDNRARLRPAARTELGLDNGTVLIGFVSSGNLRKRGIHHLLAAAELIYRERADARFLVVGSSAAPVEIRDHVLFRNGTLIYRPKSGTPERWYAALDIFLYPAEWEEFGIVVAEALAMGLPVLTSRRVGAAECLPDEYAPWLADQPDPERLAADALRLLREPKTVSRLVAAGTGGSSGVLDDIGYGDRAAALILNQKR